MHMLQDTPENHLAPLTSQLALTDEEKQRKRMLIALGILLAAGTRFLLLAVHLEEALSPPIVMYPCLAAFFTFGLWLLVFH